MAEVERAHALGQLATLTGLDRFGNWLSVRKIAGKVGSTKGRRVGDFGSGYHARIALRLSSDAAELTVADLALSPELSAIPTVRAIEGNLPDTMADVPDDSIDVALCISVLEHLDRPQEMLNELRRVLAPGGVLFVNVPSWRGKIFLEFFAFRVKLSTPDEMDDHRMYYDPPDLWPLLVAAGFKPRSITCRRYKAGMNTYALCRADA